MGTLVIVAFLTVMKFLNFLKPKPAQPTIDSYGQTSSGVEQQQIQSLMEWLVPCGVNTQTIFKPCIPPNFHSF
jgi:hypothetical protein